VRISPEIVHLCEADVFSPAEGSIRQRPLLRGRADSPGSLAQGMLHRDGPGTEESSPSPLTPGGPPLEMGREVRATKGRPEEARTDLGAGLQPHSTDEGGEPQGSRKGRPRYPLEGRGKQAYESVERRHNETQNSNFLCAQTSTE
jgi:hypothetical protein